MQLGLGVLGLEDAAQRGRARACSRSWPRPGRSTARRCASGSACTRAARGLPRRAGGARACSSATDGRYANTPATDLFLDRAKPSYVGGMLEMANARLYAFWGSLTEALRTGRAAERGEEPAATSSRRSTPTRRGSRSSRSAMTGVSLGAGAAIAAKFPWQDHRSVVDVGCARAPCRCRSRWRTRTSPAAASTCPPVEPIFDDYVGRLRARRPAEVHAPATSSRTRCPSADVLVMGHILHDWDLDEKRLLLQQGLRRAARRRGADRLRGDHRRRAARATPSAC